VVHRVGHVGLTVVDLEKSIAFAEGVMGLRVAERDGATAYLTCNDRHHELVLTKGSRAGCDHLAFEVFDAGGLAELRQAVARRGLPLLEAPTEAGVAEAFRFEAPGGLAIELFHGMAHDQPRGYETTGARPRKFEHITVKSSRKDELEELFVSLLGLRVSDRAEDAITWLRVSDEHHGVSVIGADVDELHHYAWQLDHFGEIAGIGDRLMRDGRTFLWGPGHHGIGDNYFCYFYDPAGNVVEYSAAIQRIEDDAAHEPRVWPDEPLSVNRWGNPGPPPEFFAAGTPLLTGDALVGR